MDAPRASLVFVDNSVNHLFRSLEVLKSNYPGLLVFTSETEFLEYFHSHLPDVIFLNLDLKPNDGVLMTREIRSRFPSSPPFIVLYSQRHDDFALELAFASGADSFINFQNKGAVLSLFIKNLLRRKKDPVKTTPKKILVDEDKFLVFKQGESVQLPRKEFRLFELLCNHPDKFFSKQEIAELIWDDVTVAKTRTIDVHIYNIRQLLGKRIVQSQKGKGYRINKRVLE